MNEENEYIIYLLNEIKIVKFLPILGLLFIYNN